MNLYGNRWRNCLLGDSDAIFQLRTIKLDNPKIEDLPVEEIDRDLNRTFPKEPFFTDNIEKIRNVLLWYAYTNPSVPYCQCFSYLCFILYKCFYENDKKHCMIDSFYCMHKMVLLLKPLLPKTVNDEGPLKFAQTLESVILLDTMKYDRKLFVRLKGSPIIKFIIFSGFSCYYLNWFNSNDGTMLLNYIIDTKASNMFQRLLNFTVAFLLVNKSMFFGFDDEICLEMLHEKHLINFYSILWKAKSLVELL